MFGMLILHAFIVALAGVVILMIRNYSKRVEIHKRVLNQIKEENEIWSEVLKRKDVNKV